MPAPKQVFEKQTELLLDLVQHAPVGIGCVDGNLNYLSINDQLAAMNGVPAADHIGKNVADIVPSLLPAVRAITDKIALTGEPTAGHELSGETLANPGELRHWREAWFPVRDQQGDIAAYGVLVEDITDQKRAEQELRAAEARLQSAMYVAGAGSWDLDLATGRNIWSDSHFTLFGYEPTPDRVAPGHYWKNAIAPETMPRLLAEWERAEREHDTFRLEHEITRANDGQRIAVRSAGRFFYDEQGKASRFVGAFVDVSQERKSQDALRALGAELRHFLDNAGVALTRCSRTLRYESVNREYADLVGHPVEQLVGADIREVLGPEAFAIVEPHIAQVLQGQRVEYESNLPLLKGGSRYVRVVYTPWRDEAGEVLGWIASITDISARRETEEKLRTSEERFRTLVDVASQITWVTNADGVVEEDSPSWRAYTGLGMDKWLGWNWLETVHPDDRESIAAAWRQAVDTVTPYTVRFRQFHHSGDYRECECRAAPIIGADGKVREWVGMSWDVTERNRVAAALAHRERQLQLITDAMPALVAYIDRDLRYRFNNSTYEDWYGIPREDLFGKSMEEVLGADALAALRPHLDRVLQGESAHFEVEVPYATGGHRWIDAHYMPDITEHGEVAGIFVLVLDITDRKETEQKLRRWSEELEHAVSEKTAELVQTHERLRALATELNLAEQRERRRIAADLHDHLQQILVLAKMKLGQGKRAAKDVPTCTDMLDQVDEVLTEALGYTRTLVADLSPPAMREFGLPAGLRWLREYMKRHELEVSLEIEDNQDLHLPEEQAMLLFQSVRELLMNAWKHSGVAEAAVTLNRQGDSLIAQVRDAGKGFDPARPQQQDADSVSTKFGLFSIRERMYALGGKFEIASEPGVGTVATLTLPLLTHRKKKRPQDALSSTPGGDDSLDTPQAEGREAGAPVRVILVDDHKIVRQGLRSLLEGYDDLELVGEAGDGKEAIALVEEVRPAVVVMDIDMPRMNGIEATGKIKSRFPHIVVIGLSVNAGGENQEAMKSAGAATLLPKEAAADQLYELICRLAVEAPTAGA